MQDTADAQYENICKIVSEELVPRKTYMTGFYGRRKILFCDNLLTSRQLKTINSQKENYVLPLYANTHTNTGYCAVQTTHLRNEARKVVKDFLGCSAEDALIFVGSSSSDCIDRVVKMAMTPFDDSQQIYLIKTIFGPELSDMVCEKKTITFVDVEFTENGCIDRKSLKSILKKRSSEFKCVCLFHAVNPITGCQEDVKMINSIVHEFEGISVWDYTSGINYSKISMNPSEWDERCDVVVVSGSSILGAINAVGVIASKKYMFKSEIPTEPGGGTVVAVTRKTVKYAGNIEDREEAGTPNIIGSIQLGLAIQYRSKMLNKLNENFLEDRKMFIVNRFLAQIDLKNQENCVYFGSKKVDMQYPIFSFALIHRDTGKLVHPEFVCELLGDLFGIQCSCVKVKHEFFNQKMGSLLNRSVTQDDNVQLIRVSFNEFACVSFVDEVARDVRYVIEHGWKFLARNCDGFIVLNDYLTKIKLSLSSKYLLKFAENELNRIVEFCTSYDNDYSSYGDDEIYLTEDEVAAIIKNSQEERA